MNKIKLSIIIPTYNEENTLPTILSFLFGEIKGNEAIEIIVSDGGSTDQTVYVAKSYSVKVVAKSKGRGVQMNNAAKMASGEMLYFLHCDSFPPSDFINQILSEDDTEKQAGCFRLKFDWDHWFLRLNAWFTRFDINAIRFGDQSLFITKHLFQEIGGFREDLIIMEDQEIVSRISKKTKFHILPKYITTSARKYRINGVYRMQFIFLYLYFLYQIGIKQEKLVAAYKRLIKTH